MKKNTKCRNQGFFRKRKRCAELYILVSIPVILVIVFGYIPMVGNLIAFQDYSVRKGLLGSDFVGLKYFKQFLAMPIFADVFRNTVVLSLYGLIAGFPIPIILALAFNELKNGRLKKTMQTITYAPFFISTVVIVGILQNVFSYRFGIVNEIVKMFGHAPIDFVGSIKYFRSMYVWSGIWQGAGYSAVLYIAALSGIDSSLHEAAIIDGATRLQRVRFIDIPGIMPTIIITFIMNTGSILNIGFEKVFLMQNPSNYAVSEIISTYVYKVGVKQAQFSYSTAISLFNAAINFTILFITNMLAKKYSETSLF